MPVYLTPGVYFERPEARTAPEPLRTDVAGFVGLAERGPLHTPTRLETWRQFQQSFGGFLPYAHLAYAVRGFFENGGRACWVVRAADSKQARCAAVAIPDGAGVLSAYRATALYPGTWGDNLAVSVQPAALASTRSVVVAKRQSGWLAVSGIAGFERGSWLRLTQSGVSPAGATLPRILNVDIIRGILQIDVEPTTLGLHPEDAANPIGVESVGFSLLVWENDQIRERFDNLAPDAEHSRYAVSVVNASSKVIGIERGAGDALPTMPWRKALDGGTNGLRTLTIFDYVGTPQGDLYGLAALARIDEVGLLAIPDLTLVPPPPQRSEKARPRGVDKCDLDMPSQRTDLTARVEDVETGAPLADVEVSEGPQEAGADPQKVKTAQDGTFTLTNLIPGLLDVTFTVDGYEQKTVRIKVLLTSGGPQLLAEPITLTPIDMPPALDIEDIFYGQSAMVMQCETLRDRFAVIDPPLDAQGNLPDISRLQSWRARFDTAFAALYYPWLRVTDPFQVEAPQGRLVPPSGHVVGVYAATDNEVGVFRPPANRALEWTDDVAAKVDDALQGILNPQGINAIRAFPGRGIRVFGARTMSSDSAWRFVNVRRLMSMLEEAIYDGLQWAVFEPNNPQLWFGLRLSLIGLLDGLWRRGAFVGDTPEAAYTVRCDATTTTPEDQAEGRVIVEIRVAPTVPYEFIVLRLGVTADELQISEV